jgi:hypothetical protein
LDSIRNSAAKKAAAAERERCAKVVESFVTAPVIGAAAELGRDWLVREIAKKIRG